MMIVIIKSSPETIKQICFLLNYEVNNILKFGNRVIPCDGRLPKDSAMYRLFNTNFHELAKIRKNQVKGEVKNPDFLYGQLRRSE